MREKIGKRRRDYIKIFNELLLVERFESSYSLNRANIMSARNSGTQSWVRRPGRILSIGLLLCTTILVSGAQVTAPSAPVSSQAATGLTIRVDASSAAPRLMVNGLPVRARMFFGGPGSAPIRIEPDGRSIEFEFIAENDSLGAGTLHFRFGQIPGDVFLDNIHIVDVASGKDVTAISDFEGGPDSFSRAWTFWPPGAANTVGTVKVEPSVGQYGTAGLHVTLHRPAAGEWPDWHIYHLPNLPLVRGNHYRVTFWARAEPARDVTVALYRPGDPFVHLGGPPGAFESQIKLAAKAGVDFVSFPVGMPWPAPGEPADWSATDNACEQVLEANPKALLLPRFGADPPDWWRQDHPDEVMTWEDGSQQHYAVVASPLYRRDAAARVAALVEHLESKFGNHVAGYHPCGQNTGEWFYQDTWGKMLNGYAPADTIAWRDWLRTRYGNDASLKAAWRDPGATLNGAVVPTAAQRRASPTGVVRDPATQKPLIDFADFQQQAMADLVCELAHAARQASQGRKLVVFFYGYLFEFGPIRLGPSTCGHYALRRVLDCPDIDVLCSPISYFDRGLGGSAPAMTAAESVALAGKMWLFEDDTRTYLGSGEFPGQFDGGKNLAETKTLLLRNVAQEATRNFATWWMDLGMTGWFNDPQMWDEMRRLAPVDNTFLQRPAPYRPEIAAVIDEGSMLETSASAWTVTDPGIYQVRRPLGRMGAPYGQYLIDDIIRGRVRSKLYVFLNAWQLSDAQRKAIRQNTRGACRVWCYAPGLHDGDRTSPEAMQELTGFRLVRVSPNKAWATPTEQGRQLGLQSSFGVDESVTPLFAADDATPGEILATYPGGAAAVALRALPEGWSLFVGAPGLTSDLLRVAARKAGVHLYTQVDCNVYANGPIVALHAAQDGPVTLDTGRKGAVQDALTDELVGDGPRITLPMKKGDTRVLRYERLPVVWQLAAPTSSPPPNDVPRQ
jgi:beta-galactosidase